MKDPPLWTPIRFAQRGKGGAEIDRYPFSFPYSKRETSLWTLHYIIWWGV